MSKILAALPAITPALIGSVALSAGASALNAKGMRDHQRRQEAANRSWLDFQERAKRDAQVVEDRERDNARAALDTNLDANTQENREAVINAETDRLEDVFTETLESTADEVMAGAQAPGRDRVFDEAMAGSLAKATGEARERLKALARATAYGGGSQWGMGQMLSQAGADAAGDIGFTNLLRNDNTALLRQKQQRSPEMLEYEQPLAVPLMQAGAMILGGAGGDFWGKEMFTGGGAPAAIPRPRPSGFSFLPTQPDMMAPIGWGGMGEGGWA